MGGQISRRYVGGSPENIGAVLCSMEARTREYELLYIIPSTFTDDEVGAIEGRVKALLEKNGASILSTNRLGKFRLAYPIKQVRHGQYVMVRLNADSQSVFAIDTALRISTEVLRHLLLKAEDVGGPNFELVQFAEVNTDAKDDRPRRRTDSVEKKSEVKAEGMPAAAPAAEISDAELEKKIATALEDKV